MASADAAPRPESMPEARPWVNVRLIHSAPIGPTGAAIEKPIASPLSRKLRSMGLSSCFLWVHTSMIVWFDVRIMEMVLLGVLKGGFSVLKLLLALIG